MVNVTNLLDKKYYTTLGTNGFVDSDPQGTYETLQEGAPRQVFLTVRKHF
jgi:iron complex outermembrane receptor protein